MRRLIARLLVALGLGLVGLGRRIEKPAPQRKITLSRRHYRVVNRAPGRWETIRLGLSILFSTARFAFA